MPYLRNCFPYLEWIVYVQKRKIVDKALEKLRRQRLRNNAWDGNLEAIRTYEVETFCRKFVKILILER